MMRQSTRRTILACALGGFVLFPGGLPAEAVAQEYPVRPVTIVVAFQPGGSNDIIARVLAKYMQDVLKQPVVVENRTGAGGNVGATYVAEAKPDGHTLLLAPIGALSINKWLYKSPGYDPDRQFAPIALLASVPNVLVVHPSVPAANLKELVALAKAKPGGLNFASMGIGTTGHLSGEMFKNLSGIDIVHVPYRGTAPAMNDLLSGQVQMMFDNLPTALSHVRSGKLRAIAVTSRKRSPQLPDVPTVEELGYPNFEAVPWFGLVAPASTPAPILDKLNAVAVAALKDGAVRARLEPLGLTLIGDSRAEFAAYIASESKKWREVVVKSGAKAE
jgi:tripartite-type tricarboxylate transporter receptor subunit TctC